MENHLIIFDMEATEQRVKHEMEKYLIYFSKESVKEYASKRKIVVESLDVQIFFRKRNTGLHKFLSGMTFKSVKFIDTYPTEKAMNMIYPIADEIKIEKTDK